ncbi:MAG: lysophospholipase [Gemmatimonas sp.]|nr:lysophospholipase [Gemmatimonas sp.]
MRFTRYVAIGDSSTEGLEDPGEQGRHRGWADRLALHVAQTQGAALLYANLAIRGRKTREVRDEQLAPALAMRPDLASVFAGTNDIIRSKYRESQVIDDLRAMHAALRGIGATVVTITMPDLSEVAPFAERARPRLLAFNAAVRALCAETGSLLLDVAQHPVACDPRLWHEDRLHANAEGHRRIAAGLASVLGLPGFDEAWATPLPPRVPLSAWQRARAEAHWVATYLTPWLLRRLTGKSSGDGVTAKRPTLQPIGP